MSKTLILLSMLLAAALPGWAVLGGSAESVVTDQVKMRANRTVVETHEYTVHEISSGDGTLVKEYVTPGGRVFGVSWTGPTIPDLSQLLGTYNAEYQNAVHAKAGQRRGVAVHNSDLVVENAGHLRAFHGRAYLTSLLPAGVTPETVK
jgi:hypothetical protein